MSPFALKAELSTASIIIPMQKNTSDSYSLKLKNSHSAEASTASTIIENAVLLCRSASSKMPSLGSSSSFAVIFPVLYPNEILKPSA